jgi:hypothetical protein
MEIRIIASWTGINMGILLLNGPSLKDSSKMDSLTPSDDFIQMKLKNQVRGGEEITVVFVHSTGNTWSPIEKQHNLANGQMKQHEPQDRIDFIFYCSHRLRPIFSFVYSGNSSLNKEKPGQQGNDWPSDHAAVITDFEVFN